MSTQLVCATEIDLNGWLVDTSGSVGMNPFPVCNTGWTVAQSFLGFDVSQLDPASIMSAFVSGAAVCFVPLSIAWACAFLLSTISGK